MRDDVVRFMGRTEPRRPIGRGNELEGDGRWIEITMMGVGDAQAVEGFLGLDHLHRVSGGAGADFLSLLRGPDGIRCKMLQRISSFVGCSRVRGHQLAWRYTCQIQALYSRGFSTATTEGGRDAGRRTGDLGTLVEGIETGQSVDQSFTATHCTADGRKFEFATVVVKAMTKRRSPLNVWQHACSLIGSSSPPTFAVAFVSKPSESAEQALRDFAQQLAFCNKPLAPPRQDSETRSSTLEAAVVETAKTSFSHDTAKQSISTQSEFRSSAGAGVTGKEFDGQHTEIPPFVACIMDDMGDFESRETGQSSASSSQTQKDCSPRASHVGTRRDRAFGSDRTPFDDDEDEASLSDWEGVCTEYLDEAAKVSSKPTGRESDDQEEDEQPAESINVSYEEEVSKEGLVSFLNALTKPPESLSEESGVKEDGLHPESSETKAIMQNRKVDDGTHGLIVSDIGHKMAHKGNCGDEGVIIREFVPSHGGLGRDDPGSSPVQIWTGAIEPNAGPESNVEKWDDDYRLILCVGHMPGAKALAFHSSTTGLPRLPDLEEAVTTNNPHMLLLGAPGFVFPDFIQRLSSVFPLSCRAGAFLAPLFTNEKSQWTKVAEKTSSPLFFGSNVVTTGVVGLAISAKERGVDVPADAFAEFVRMSIAMPRIPGFVFLDEAISTKLFLPKNVAVQHLFSSPGSSVPGASSLVLDQLSRKLMKENVRLCVEKGKPFGLSAMYNGSWTTDADESGEIIGTVANLKVHSFQRDCRSYIIAHGLRRFRVPNERICAEPGSFGLTTGQVQYFDDKECETKEEREDLAELAKRAVALCLEVIPEGLSVPALVKSTYDPIVASFAVGHIMNVPTRVKRRWLKMVNTKTRLTEQIAFLETKASSLSNK
ncbi:hypothetical protein AXG93_4343s1210 [Marchantia polymorpha subsp. ruderalis]|uniref:Uncharacterized protein n=1 Tax=Marchantia polymorpha subsp. ruderalis TaxID=1480154 RepID=A0A176VU70_MARPO|nr:hypothetical protein AXG93_4343s1210 [Marchantia polymorpha subsp. ruderalis]